MLWYQTFFLVCIFLHILCCVLILLGIQRHMLKVRTLMFLVALLLPIWGILLVLILHFEILCNLTDEVAVGVEKFQVDSELYKNVDQEDRHTARTTVSMEEALIINTPKERRTLIMDILNDNPKSYVEFLKMAGNNDDTEVVHYAVTAMVQISKENDQILWEFEQKYAQNPEDLDTIQAYSEFLWHCLEQGLMQGQVERMNRNLFDTLIQKKIRLDAAQAEDYARGIQNNMCLNNYTAAGAMIETARKLWPRNEDFLILQVHYLADLQRADALEALLKDLDEKNIYLSAKAKEVIAFWRD